MREGEIRSNFVDLNLMYSVGSIALLAPRRLNRVSSTDLLISAELGSEPQPRLELKE